GAGGVRLFARDSSAISALNASRTEGRPGKWPCGATQPIAIAVGCPRDRPRWVRPKPRGMNRAQRVAPCSPEEGAPAVLARLDHVARRVLDEHAGEGAAVCQGGQCGAC